MTNYQCIVWLLDCLIQFGFNELFKQTTVTETWVYCSQTDSCWKNEYLVEDLHRFVELYIPQEWRQVLEEINEQLCVHGPTLQDNISPLHQNPRTANMGRVLMKLCIPSAAECVLASWR